MKKFLFVFLFLLFGSGFSFAADMVDINTASLEQLDTLAGIGPAYAQRITDARPFSSVDDLIRVNGIGEKTLQKIKEQGLAYVSGQSQQQVQTESPAQNTDTASQTEEISPPTPTSTIQTEAPVITYPGGIIFNEVLPSPQGADDEEELFELQNTNNFEVDLFGWQVKDNVGTITTFIIPEGAKISAYSFLSFKRPETKIILNNDEDGLILFSPEGKSVDSVSFTKSPTGQSYNKTSSGWAWSTTLTPGAKNVIIQPAAASKTKKSSDSDSPAGASIESEKLIDDLLSEKSSASISGSNSSPWLLFIATIIAIIFAAIVLFLKKFLDKKKALNTQE